MKIFKLEYIDINNMPADTLAKNTIGKKILNFANKIFLNKSNLRESVNYLFIYLLIQLFIYNLNTLFGVEYNHYVKI